MDEFEVIRRYFQDLTPSDTSVALGIGDDCCLLNPEPGRQLAMSTDTLLAGRHFLASQDAADIAYKSLAVSLSDLAAMGARPRWFSLALTLPKVEEAWLEKFALGLAECAQRFAVSLVGGDTTRGPLAVTINIIGSVVPGQASRRDGAKPGDLICVTGTLGDAALALSLIREKSGRKPVESAQLAFLESRLHRPTPRLEEGLALAAFASAAIDLSDGLAGDLGHVLRQSRCGALLYEQSFPQSPAFSALTREDQRTAMQTRGGDDYELCICLPRKHFDSALALCPCGLSIVGEIEAEAGLRLQTATGDKIALPAHGYRHFE